MISPLDSVTFIVLSVLLVFLVHRFVIYISIRKVELVERPASNRAAATPKPTPLTVRISGFPNTITKDQLRTLLEDLQKTTPPCKNILCLSLVPSVSSGTKKTATVSYRDVPKEFEHCKEFAVPHFATLPESKEEICMQVDAHFCGLTPLSTPEKPTVDIVAVTGLAGNAFGSWKSSSGQDMWLRDFLPGDLKRQKLQARILTYGYDSTLDKSQSFASIHDYSRRLLEALKNARLSPAEQKRPIIFLGHSLGGILVKHALKEAASGGNKDKLILISSYALLFFGVPNRGIDIASLKTMVCGQPNEELVRNLGPNSHLLPELEREFYRIFEGYQDSKVVSFYETKMTATAERSVNGVWKRTGVPILMVTSTSATKSAPGEQFHDQLALDGDHSSMVKFTSPEVEDYNIVSGRILEYVEEAPVVIEKRFAGIRKRSEFSEIETKCIEALNTPDYVIFRKHREEDLVHGPFEWFLENDKLKAWHDAQGSSILWVSGPPGQGKTVLARSFLQFLEETIARQPEPDDDEVQPQNRVIYFFFYGQDEKYRTVSAILRSLIHQLLVDAPASLFDHILHIYEKKGCKFTDSNEDLWEIFNAIINDPILHTIFCVIDALDQCESSQEQGSNSRKDFLNRISELCVERGATGSSKRPRFKLLVTSRPEKEIVISLQAFRDCKIDLQVRHQDIVEYIGKRIDGQYEVYTEQMRKVIKHELGRKSGNTFLWTSTVLKEIIKMDLPTQDEIRIKMQQLPATLKDVYQELFTQILDRSRDKALPVFLWIAYARRPMSVSELQGALATKPESKSIKDTSNNMAVLNKHTITRLAGSVLEVINDDVRFIHKSAKYFLIESRYFQDLDVGSRPEMHLGKVCLRYLSFGNPNNRIDDWSVSEGWLNPFFEYAAFNWYHHFPHDDDNEIRYMVERAKGFRKTKTDLLHSVTEQHFELEQDNDCPRVTIRSCLSRGTIISNRHVGSSLNVAQMLCVETSLNVSENLNLSGSGGLCVGSSLHVGELLNLAGGGLYVGSSLHVGEVLNLVGGELYVGSSLHVGEVMNLVDGGLYVGRSLHVGEVLNLAGGRLYVGRSLHVGEVLYLTGGRMYVGSSLHVGEVLKLVSGGLYVGGSLHVSGNLNLAGGGLYVGGSLHVSGCLSVDGGWLYVGSPMPKCEEEFIFDRLASCH